MIISRTKYFQKRFKSLDKKIQQKFHERLRLFIKNPNHPILKSHPLKGDYIGRRSFSITGNFRAIYLIVSKEEIRFTNIGTHPQVY